MDLYYGGQSALIKIQNLNANLTQKYPQRNIKNNKV